MDDSQVIINTKLQIIDKTKNPGGGLGMDIIIRCLDDLDAGQFTNRRKQGLSCRLRRVFVG
jgi:hypothetical protein